MILGRTSWIADELIGIRTLEQQLSKKLKSGRLQNRQYLLGNIQDLNWRVEMLDRALDEVGTANAAPSQENNKRASGGRASLHE